MYNLNEKLQNQYYINNPKYFDELVCLCQPNKIKTIHQYLKYSHKYLMDWINANTQKLVENGNSLSTKIHWILNNISDFPICQNEQCSNKIYRDVGINKKHPKFCCFKCSLPYIVNAGIKTCLSKYGITNGGGSLQAQQKMHKKYFYDDRYFDSAPEIAIYIYLKDNNIPFIYHPDMPLAYYYNQQQRYCYPDFEVDGQLVEIKGDQFLKEDDTWQNPYNHAEDAHYECKHQCLIDNNVKILYGNDYTKYVEYVEQKYGKYYLHQFRKNKEPYIRKMPNISITCENLSNNIYYIANPDLFMELKSLIEQNPKSYVGKLNGMSNQNGKQKILKFQYLANWINQQLPLLQDPIYKMNTKCYWIMHGLIDFPLCSYCGHNEKYKLKNIRSFQDGYKQFCSVSCGTSYSKHLKTT